MTVKIHFWTLSEYFIPSARFEGNNTRRRCMNGDKIIIIIIDVGPRRRTGVSTVRRPTGALRGADRSSLSCEAPATRLPISTGRLAECCARSSWGHALAEPLLKTHAPRTQVHSNKNNNTRAAPASPKIIIIIIINRTHYLCFLLLIHYIHIYTSSCFSLSLVLFLAAVATQQYTHNILLVNLLSFVARNANII